YPPLPVLARIGMTVTRQCHVGGNDHLQAVAETATRKTVQHLANRRSRFVGEFGQAIEQATNLTRSGSRRDDLIAPDAADLRAEFEPPFCQAGRYANGPFPGAVRPGAGVYGRVGVEHDLDDRPRVRL